MKDLILYQIEVAICMAALALLYVFFWRKETNFAFKRILLLGIPSCSIVIPLINLNINLQPAQETATFHYITYLPNQLELIFAPIVDEAERMSGWQIAFWAFAIGVFVMLLRIVVSYYRIWQLYRQSVVDVSGDFRLIGGPVQSFSFFNLVIINRSQAHSNERDYILSHEKAHSRQGHSYDVLWLELVKMLHWFNPMIWLISRESKQNLEYLADQEVATKGQNIENYQYAIIHHATSSGTQILKTQFSKSNLKNRIIMMYQPKNRKINPVKLLALLPVLAILFMSFSMNMENLDLKQELSGVLPVFNPASFSITESTNLQLVQKIQSTNKNGLKTESRKPTSLEKEGQIESRKIGGTITTETGNPVIGCNVIIKGTQIGTISDGEGRFLLEVEPEHAELVFSYVGLLSKTVFISEETNYNIILDNDPEYASSSQPEILSGNIAVGRPIKLDPYRVTIRSTKTLQDLKEDAQPLFLIDGKESVEYEMSEINPDDIESIHVLKNKSAIAIYGDKGVNGVILITTKESRSKEPVYTDVTIIDDNNKDGLKLKTDGNLDFGQEDPPLFYIDGVESTQKDVEKLDRNSIESISVIKGQAAKEKYGKKGKDGVILIKMKK